MAQLASVLEVQLKDAPAGLRKLPLKLEHLAAALAARAGESSSGCSASARARAGGFIVEARQAAKDETEFSGSYVLTVSSEEAAPGTPARTLKARGRASCSLKGRMA